MSEHIDHIEITNFKSIRHQKIEECKRINVFIGYPNVGKSAILEAISALSYLQKDFNENFNRLCRLKESYELFYNGNAKEDVKVKFTNEVNAIKFNYISEKEIGLSVELYLNKEDISPFFSRTMTFSNGLLGSDGWSGPKQANNNIIKIKKYTFNNVYNEFKTNGLSLFSPYGENLVDIIHLNKEVRKEVADLFKFYNLKLLIDPSTNTIRGFKELGEEIIFTIPFHQMADTLQRLIFHKAAIMSNENTVLLFEEPEAHMFPPYITQLTSDIINDKNNNQYFISTHSPFVLNDLMEDAKEELSIYAVGLHKGETTIKRITKEEMHEIYQYGIDLFFNLEDYLKDV